MDTWRTTTLFKHGKQGTQTRWLPPIYLPKTFAEDLGGQRQASKSYSENIWQSHSPFPLRQDTTKSNCVSTFCIVVNSLNFGRLFHSSSAIYMLCPKVGWCKNPHENVEYALAGHLHLSVLYKFAIFPLKYPHSFKRNYLITPTCPRPMFPWHLTSLFPQYQRTKKGPMKTGKSNNTARLLQRHKAHTTEQAV